MVRERVRSGELTVRSLARATGVSQPHLHNILKGIRSLSPELGDQILRQLGLTLLDFREPKETRKPPRQSATLEAGAVPRFRGRIGPSSQRRQYLYSFPISSVEYLTDPVVLILRRDDSMLPGFPEGDVVLLERSEEARMHPVPEACYAVDLTYAVAVRYLRVDGSGVYTATEKSLGNPREWEYLSPPGKPLLEKVRGRVVWMGRQLDSLPVRPVRKAG